MYYEQELIEEIRLQNDIVDIVSQYVQLKRRGSSYFGLCPFHNEKTPSFSVSSDKQIFYCFGCGVGGNVISFVMQIENYDFVEAIKFLAEKANIVLPEPQYSEEAKKQAQQKKILYNIHKDAARYFYSNLHNERGRTCLKYINERKISLKYQKVFGLGFANYARSDLYSYLLSRGYEDDLLLKSGLVIKEKTKEGYFDRFGNRLMFPIFDIHNNIIGFGGRIIGQGQPKYLNSPETLLFDKSKTLYGLNYARASKKNQIIVVEGYMDVIALHQAGFNNAVASLGTAFNIEHAKLIRKYCQEVVLIYDSDLAGTNAALRAIPILVSSGLSVKILQVKDSKDPDEYIKIYGADAFNELLKTATNYLDFQIECIKKKYNLEDTLQKVQFTNEVSKLLSKLDNAIEQDAYIKQVSEIAGISENSIKQEIAKAINKAEKTAIINPHIPSKPISKYNYENNEITKGVIKAEQELLNIISNNNLVYYKLKNYLKADDFIEPCFKKLASKIYELCENKGNICPAELINYFDDAVEQKMVTEVFAITEEYNDMLELEKTINDHVRIILKSGIEKIYKKAKESYDIPQMQKLMEDKRNIDKLNITLADG